MRAGTSMPGFSDMGISHSSSVMRLTVMSVLRFMSKMKGLVSLTGNHVSSYIEHHTDLPATACLLEFVEVLRDPLHIGMEFLCLLVHQRADQTCTQQPNLPVLCQSERCLPEDHSGGVLPVDHFRQPIEQQIREVHRPLFNRALPFSRHCSRI